MEKLNTELKAYRKSSASKYLKEFQTALIKKSINSASQNVVDLVFNSLKKPENAEYIMEILKKRRGSMDQSDLDYNEMKLSEFLSIHNNL